MDTKHYIVQLFNYTMELVKMSGKGQLVVPQGIRTELGCKEGDRFMAIQTSEGILFKRVDLGKLEQQFERLSRTMQEHTRTKGITQADLDEAIRWAKQQRS
jgi:AbrB family looped-hinge helix DNA binding protein